MEVIAVLGGVADGWGFVVHLGWFGEWM